MKNLFCSLNFLAFLLFKNSFSTNFDFYCIEDSERIISELINSCTEPTTFEIEISDDFEMLECNDLSFPLNILDDNYELSHEIKKNMLIEKPNEYLTKYLEELKNVSSLINDPINRLTLLNYIDKTIDMINLFFSSFNYNEDDNVIILRNIFEIVALNFENLVKLFEEVELLYEEKKNKSN